MSRKQHAHTIRLPKSRIAKFATWGLVILAIVLIVRDPLRSAEHVNALFTSVSTFASQFGGGQ